MPVRPRAGGGWDRGKVPGVHDGWRALAEEPEQRRAPA